jgi:hypothetical protein
MLKIENAFIRETFTCAIMLAYEYYFNIIFCNKKYAKVRSIYCVNKKTRFVINYKKIA